MSFYVRRINPGYPDYATQRLLVRILLGHSNGRHPSIPLMILTDADPHGINIASIYSKYIHKHVQNPRLHWIGVMPSEHTEASLNISPSAILSLQDREKTITRNLLANREFKQSLPRSLVEVMCRELKFMLDHDVKFEVEALVASRTHNMLQNIRRHREIMPQDSHPVLSYIRRKIAQVMSLYS